MKLKVTEAEVSQEINVKDLLGSAADIDTVTEAFAQAVIDRIKERTEQGRDVNGKVFAPYSKSYKDSLAYQVFGKTGAVNMTLTGDMLGTMFTETENGKFKIKFNGEDNNVKAFAHITGFNGHPTLGGKVKPREFFGITDDELTKIKKNFLPDLGKESKKNDDVLLNKLKKLFGG